MIRCRTIHELRPATVALIADRLCGEFAIVSGNAWLARDIAVDGFHRDQRLEYCIASRS